MLDATDRALIALLRENARIGHAEAARRLKLSRTTVQARVESLERRKILRDAGQIAAAFKAEMALIDAAG